MLRATYRLAILSVLVAASSVGHWYFHNPQSPAVRIAKLEEEKKELQQIVQRLTDERRAAEMIVTDQRKTDQGLETTLLFVEQARDGSPLPPKSPPNTTPPTRPPSPAASPVSAPTTAAASPPAP